MADMHIDMAEKREGLPEFDNFDLSGSCPSCGAIGNYDVSHGLAGGGYGTYAYCLSCDAIVAKTDEQTES